MQASALASPALADFAIPLMQSAKVGSGWIKQSDCQMVGTPQGWRPGQYVLCANEDIPYSPQAIERFYGSKFPLFVSLRFN